MSSVDDFKRLYKYFFDNDYFFVVL